MSPKDGQSITQVYRVEGEDGSRFIVYNAAAIGNPADHVPDKWYARPYPVAIPLGGELGEAFDTPEDAERAVLARHARLDGAPRSG